MPVKQMDVLVHPFYSFSDYDARREVWQKRIDAIAGNRHHYLAIELFSIDRSEAGDLVRYAKKKLGEQRVLVFQRSELDTYKTLARRVEGLGYDRSKIKVNFYGETSTHCVLDAVKAFLPELVPKSRYRQAAKGLRMKEDLV